MKSEKDNVKVLDEDAWESCAPMSGYLQVKEGFNYYMVNEKPYRVEIEGKNGTFERIMFDVNSLLVTDENGRKTLDSPEEPIESTLSLPTSVGRSMRKMCESLNLTFDSLVGQVLKVYRIGSGMETRYPKLDLMSIEEFKDIKPKK